MMLSKNGMRGAASIRRRVRLRLRLVLLFFAVFLVYGSYKGLQHAVFDTRDFETGIYANIAWNVAHGRGFYSDVIGRTHLGEHFSPVMALLAPLVRVFPADLVVLITLAACVALTFPLLVLLCEELLPPERFSHRERRAVTSAILVLAFSYYPLFSALRWEVHPSTFGMPMVAGAILLLHRGGGAAFWVLVVLLASTKEVAFASIAGLGIYAWSVLGQKRTALILLGAGAVGGALVTFVVIPGFRGDTWQHVSRLGPFVDLPEKTLYVFLLGALLGFLPFFAWRPLLAAIPTTFLNCVVGYAPQYSLHFHYDDQNVVFWLVAAIHGAAAAAVWSRRFSTRRRLSTVAVGAGFILVFFCVVLLPNAIRDLTQKIPGPEVRRLHSLLEPWKGAPPDVALASMNPLNPHLRYRYRYVSLNRGFDESLLQAGDVLLIPLPASGLETPIDTTAVARILRGSARAEVLVDDPVLLVARWKEEPDG